MNSPLVRPQTCATIRGEERVARDVEGHAEKKIRAPLIKLATECAILDVELEERVARRQRHRVDLRRVPCRDDEPAAVGLRLDLLDHAVDLVDSLVVRPAPVAPLRAVNPAEITLLVGPFIPDRDSLLLEVADVRVAAQKPEQLVNDRFEMQLFRREEREAVAQIEAGLGAENRKRTRSSPIAPRSSLSPGRAAGDPDIPAWSKRSLTSPR